MKVYDINCLISKAIYTRDVEVKTDEGKQAITQLCNFVTNNMNVIAEDYEEDE